MKSEQAVSALLARQTNLDARLNEIENGLKAEQIVYSLLKNDDIPREDRQYFAFMIAQEYVSR